MTDTKMQIWDALKTPPIENTKEIKGGRLKGKTDINPQWRLQVMTKQFGPCGIGWRYVVEKLWTVPAGAGGEVVAFAEVNVFIGFQNDDGEKLWSQPIPGIGGNMLIVQESGGLHINDECYKMAITDALSVAFKALGVAADVYMGKFDSKYDKRGGGAGDGGGRQKRQPRDEGLGKCKKCGTFMKKVVLKDGSGRWFIGCQGFPDCKYTKWPDKDEKPKPAPAAAPKTASPAQRSAPAAPAAPEATVADLPKHGAVEEAEEMCPACGNHPADPWGRCPPPANQDEEQPQEQAPQEWRPQCCDRTMMPRAGPDGGPPFWQCPRCKKKKDMSEEERKRVGL